MEGKNGTAWLGTSVDGCPDSVVQSRLGERKSRQPVYTFLFIMTSSRLVVVFLKRKDLCPVKTRFAREELDQSFMFVPDLSGSLWHPKMTKKAKCEPRESWNDLLNRARKEFEIKEKTKSFNCCLQISKTMTRSSHKQKRLLTRRRVPAVQALKLSTPGKLARPWMEATKTEQAIERPTCT